MFDFKANDIVKVSVNFKADFGESIHVLTNGKIVPVSRKNVFIDKNQNFFVNAIVKSFRSDSAFLLIGPKVLLVSAKDIYEKNITNEPFLTSASF